MNTTSAKILTVAAVTALGLTLASCSTDTTTPEAPEATATAAADDAAATPSETPEPEVPTFATGDVIAPEQAELLPEHQVAYTLTSGETVVVDKEQRLPDPVLNEVTSLVAQYVRNDAETLMAQFMDAQSKIREIQRETGRAVVYVWHTYSDGSDGITLPHDYWTAVFVDEPKSIMVSDTDANFEANRHATPEAAVAYAENVISRTQYDANYDVVVVQ
jgi:hypothetical protein